MPFAPLYDRILVRTKVKDTRTASGIVIPSSREQRPDQGEVVAVGHGHFLTDGKTVPLHVKVGDIVQFDPARSGEEITVDGEALVLFHEHEIMGIITSK
jgi:chaperonin GroES